MGIDRSDDADADAPSPEPPDHSPDRADPPAADGGQSRRDQIEPRSHDEYYTQLHATTNPEDQTDPADRSEPEDHTEPADRSEPEDHTEPADRSEPGSRSKTGDTSENGEQAPEKAAQEPSAKPSDHSPDRADAPADDRNQPRREQVEPRSREEPHTDLRADTEVKEQTEPAGRSEPGARSKPEQSAENGQQTRTGASWAETVDLARWMWGKYKLHFQREERAPVDRSEDPPGTWYGEGDRKLEPLKNQRIEAECDRIADWEEKEITPAMRAIESQDPHRHLVGFEHRLKSRDRIKEKVIDTMRLKRHSESEAISLLPDAIRFTFQYDESRYDQGVRADIERMRDQGFKLDKLKNYWSDDQYKGINSQWIEPRTGQRFELQFHTSISFEAKQITHPAYERLRTKQADAFEELVLEAFQKKFTAEVPIPHGAIDIPDYPEGDQNAR